MKIFSTLIIALVALSSQAQHHKIIVHLDTNIKVALKGRLYIFSSQDTTRGVQDPDLFNPTPTFVLDIDNWKADETKLIDSTTAAYPIKLNQIQPGYYKFAAVLDIDTEERNNTITAGNYYSRDALVLVKASEPFTIHLYLNKVIPKRLFKQTDYIKEVQLKSQLVSAFRKKNSFIKAAVVLPKSYHQNQSANYPIVFVIPGWGGTHYDVYNPAVSKRYGFTTGKEKIFIYLNPETNNPYGLHAFINSRVNGPWGKALVEELIPFLKKNYRINHQYFVVGQSSGGYAALWLQLNYPNIFTASWAVSPDPVDFSDFTGIPLYKKNVNMYFDVNGNERGMFLTNGQYLSTVKHYARFEQFLGDGGQMQSFEAAFGILDKKTKRPAELFNRQTGNINPNVIKSWKPYDLGAYYESNYNKLSAQLKNKIFVYAGSDDNFLLNRSVEAFMQRMNKLNASVTVQLIPGANHWTIWTEAFTQKMHKEIDEKIY